MQASTEINYFNTLHKITDSLTLPYKLWPRLIWKKALWSTKQGTYNSLSAAPYLNTSAIFYFSPKTKKKINNCCQNYFGIKGKQSQAPWFRTWVSAASSGSKDTLFEQDTWALRQSERQIKSVLAARAALCWECPLPRWWV